jgi:starch synthase
MAKKLFYVTTEMTPFASVSPLGDFSVDIPLKLQEMKHDLRTIAPKYGFISERKYILREVIRLRDIPFEFDGEKVSTSAKSAFIPKTRVQVYFLEHAEWFKPLSSLLYKSKNGRILSDNDVRSAFFSNSVLATLPHLFWSPDVILCNGWQSALIPALYKQKYEGGEFYKDIKTVQLIHWLDEYPKFSRGAYVKAGIEIPKSLDKKIINAYSMSAEYADAIILLNQPGYDMNKELLQIDGIKKHKSKIHTIDIDYTESADYSGVATKINEVLEKLSK